MVDLAKISKLNGKKFAFKFVVESIEGREVLEFCNERLLELLKGISKNQFGLILRSVFRRFFS